MEESVENVDVRDIFSNPFYAINIAPVMAAEHEPMVSEEMWVKVNLKIMQEIGEEEWLKSLLRSLKNDSHPSDLTEEQVENL